MPALVKLAAQPAKLGITSEAKQFISPTTDLMGVRMKHGRVVAVGGKADGTELENLVEANQQVLIYPAASINPIKYQTLVSISPELFRHGMCSCPAVVQPGAGSDIFIAFKAGKKTDLSQIEYMFTLYMID